MDFLRKKLIMNFLVKLLIENSLYLSLFSFINLNTHEMSTAAEVLSYLYSMTYFIALSGLAGANIYIILSLEKSSLKHLQMATQRYPRIETLYFQLKLTRGALIFRGVYILRTMCISLVYVAMQNYQVFQIIVQILISLVHFAYLINTMPFEVKILNVLEVINELTIIAVQYHCITLSDVLYLQTPQQTIDFKYAQGTVISYMILAIIVFRLLTVSLAMLTQLEAPLLRLFFKIRAKFAKKVKVEIIKKEEKIEDHQTQDNIQSREVQNNVISELDDGNHQRSASIQS